MNIFLGLKMKCLVDFYCDLKVGSFLCLQVGGYKIVKKP